MPTRMEIPYFVFDISDGFCSFFTAIACCRVWRKRMSPLLSGNCFVKHKNLIKHIIMKLSHILVL